RRSGRPPPQTVSAAEYPSRAVMEGNGQRKMDLLGSMPREDASTGKTAPNTQPPNAVVYQPEANRYLCPGGKLLRPQGRHNKKKPGVVAYRYEAKAEDCHGCAFKPQCCPGNQQRGRG